MKKNAKTFANVAMIAALYTVVSLALAPLSFSNIQVRIAEALTLLPIVYFPAVAGVTLGCFLTNLIGVMWGVNVLVMDIFVGTIATLVAGLLSWKLRTVQFKGIAWLSILMPILMNGIFVGIELGFLLFPNDIVTGSIICGLQVAIGEAISCIIIGIPLMNALKKTKIFEL